MLNIIAGLMTFMCLGWAAFHVHQGNLDRATFSMACATFCFVGWTRLEK